jgi:hypothetical protein
VVVQVAAALQQTGVSVGFDRWEIEPGGSISDRVEQVVQTSDFFLVFLSKASAASRWVEKELGAALAKEMKDRAITVIPVLIEDCDIPPLLSDRMYVDLRKDVSAGIQELANQLAAAPDIDLSKLDYGTFEQLVNDLLTALGFKVRWARGDTDAYDLFATYTTSDPFGVKRTENWIVETKAYAQQRVGVDTIRALVGYLTATSSATKGLLVTDSLLTSAAREFLASEVSRAARHIRVIDGTELKGLLLRHPELVGRYFPASRGP